MLARSDHEENSCEFRMFSWTKFVLVSLPSVIVSFLQQPKAKQIYVGYIKVFSKV